ncbi:sulfotransferase family 2 domain-containing protein [Cyanobium sp. CH-040]|uniref:sulfotransferase family 2 domain-containing protein n=1 Tax=Cyanobium sp. CH-040 TaxID=2823708 RepID=UPI0020CCA263|nr:sulfotransferase family 2 domain-containing protein [Cyanobium sp. CH-040]MCP9928564.1 sulfotransferase family 2 domain-containing protein [Cyanobium sp. CH-040]
MIKDLPLKVLHLHTFKCAGTTFSWILEKIFSSQVLYVESSNSSARLSWQRVEQSLDLQPYRALTSHLIDCPPPGELAALKVSFVRKPWDRYQSAFRFVRDVQHKLPQETSFRHYMESQYKGILANFQSRHLSPQGLQGFQFRQGWQLRPDLIDMDRVDLFVGVVERFDESLVALEHHFQALGLPSDLSYAAPLNTRSPGALASDSAVVADDVSLDSMPSWILNMLELDQSLWIRACQSLDRQIVEIPDFEGKLNSFRERCLRLSSDCDLVNSISVQPPARWVYLD